MIRRRVKKDVERIIINALVIAIITVVLVILGFSIKNFLPLLKLGSEQKDAIIKPTLDLVTSRDLSRQLSDRNFTMESLVEGSSSAIIIGKIADGPKVYFSKDRDIKWQITSLELILGKLTIDNKKPTLIDLRFEQPIVKF